MRIRKFREEDATKVCYLVRRNIKEILPDYYSKEVCDYLYDCFSLKKFLKRTKNRNIFVAVKRKKIIGVIELDEAQIRSFYVNPDYQNKGIGKILYNKIEEIANSKKIKKLFVKSSLNAQGFYEKLGFKKIKKTVFERDGIKIEDIDMEKNL